MRASAFCRSFAASLDIVAAPPGKLDIVVGKLTGGYGITDKLEGGIGYALAVKEFEAKGSLDANVGFAVVRLLIGCW